MIFNMKVKRLTLCGLAGVLATLTLAACSGGGGETSTSETTDASSEAASRSGGVDVQIDGSSTVFPISEAMAEEYQNDSGKRVTVGVSGSGGGFKKFCAGETDISNASRPIKESEVELCAENGIEYVEIPVAFDGVSVVVNQANDWATCLKPEELAMMWEPTAEGQITNWSQIRAEFPDVELGLYGPGTDSGTYDYFTDATTGEEGESRGDYTASEDDNVIVQGVQAEDGALGFFGYAYYEENKDTLKVVEIENSAGECVAPSSEVISDGSYNPLSRPIFFYVSKSALESNPAVKEFAEYQIDSANEELITEVGYVPLPDDILTKVQERLDTAKTGSIFEGGSSVGVKLSDKL
ncbi:PstS family phosphate ABC transporter substrate-binding protein [Oscillatoriales cyanobacterium LEGE 11467]|uniref:Phosphate-binding protein n=1 Tax=Zarconia navalis LEGE 11467 TaxID=1828826 RepID=A0A928VXD6_9CYAN|nr:PstS family phosphate ABC transporter substrate-binding protein [Zarconia navalis]MBE9039420.1 PstS family phosphate ABC transporter substrate-binding protein [Zarconia navalis LEGE 11467]